MGSGGRGSARTLKNDLQMEETAGNAVAGRMQAWCRAGLRGSREDSASCPACITGILRTSASREIRPFKNHLPSRPHEDITQCQVKAKQQPILGPRMMSQYLWSIMLATPDSYLPQLQKEARELFVLSAGFHGQCWEV